MLNGRNVFLVLVLLKYYLITVSGTAAENDYYTAAVVDYYRVIHADPEEMLNKNSDYYIQTLNDIKEDSPDLDIIVFPESTLYKGFDNKEYFDHSTVVPKAEEEIAPCDSTKGTFREFLVTLSCAARKANTYLVVNLVEKEPCTEAQIQAETCSSYKFNVYNTNAVFDRNGVIIAKYRKYNLFKEPVNQTAIAEKVIFKTDFDVEFGIFTCFDILFYEPAVALVKQNVKHFIFPSMWFSELPFLVSVQAQEMWAREYDVTLLASGANNPDNGSGGSGIFQGNLGSLGTVLTAKKGTTVIVRQVKKSWQSVEPRKVNGTTKNFEEEEISSLDDFKLIWDNNTEYTSELLNTDLEDQSVTICSTASGFKDGQRPDDEPQKFCCEFIAIIEVKEDLLKADTKEYYHYRMFAYSGVRSFSGAYNGGLEVCGLVACTNGEDTSTCGKRFTDASNTIWPISFKNLIVQAIFTKSPSRAQFPNSLKWNLQPIASGETSWVTRDINGKSHRSHKIETAQNQLLTFGIYGRDFNRDSNPNTAGHVGQEYVTLIVVFMVVLLSLVYNFH